MGQEDPRSQCPGGREPSRGRKQEKVKQVILPCPRCALSKGPAPHSAHTPQTHFKNLTDGPIRKSAFGGHHSGGMRHTRVNGAKAPQAQLSKIQRAPFLQSLLLPAQRAPENSRNTRHSVFCVVSVPAAPMVFPGATQGENREREGEERDP